MKRIKITETQYNKLFNTESKDVVGGLNRVDNTFASQFSGKNIKNLEEDNFNIKSGNVKSKEIQLPELNKRDAINKLLEHLWLNESLNNLPEFFNNKNISKDSILEFLIKKNIISKISESKYKINNVYKKVFSENKEEAVTEKMIEIQKITNDIKDDDEAPWNKENKKEMFKPILMNKEIGVLNGPDAIYIFCYDDLNLDFKNVEELTNYVNNNLDKLKIGSGVKGFESDATLIKMDESLKNEILNLYEKDKNLIKVFKRLEETTSAAGGSSGAFTGPLNQPSLANKNISPDYTPAKVINKIINDETKLYNTLEDEMIEETTAAGGTPVSSSTGQYVQPKIWAKNKANWAAAHKTQYPHGEMVEFDPCTKLNNNKSAQNGKCSQGAVDNVVKTHQTKQSVISKTIYETIAKKTGRTIDEVKNIIETKLNNNKHLS